MSNLINAQDTSLIQIRLVEVQGLGKLSVNGHNFFIKEGEFLDITSSLIVGINRLKLLVETESLKAKPSRLLDGDYQWQGRFEVYVDGLMVASYFKQGNYLLGGKQNLVESIDVNITKDTSQPTLIQLINLFQEVEGMTDANKNDGDKAHPYIVFKNGLVIHTWKNYAGVDHVFIRDRGEKCVYGGYVGWLHTKELKSKLQQIKENFSEWID